MTEVIKTCCVCWNQCGIDVHLEDGKIVKIEGNREHEVSQGYQCPKGRAVLEWVTSPKRLKYPMKRVGERGEGKWQRISWDEAIDIIATKLEGIKEEYGAKALAIMRGMNVISAEPMGGWGMRRRFGDVYGTPNYFSVDSMCFWPHMMAYDLTFGRYYAPDPDPDSCKLFMLWGRNPDQSAPFRARQIRQARKKGAKLIVVDIKRIPIAKQADIFLQPRPGTDAALALGLMNVIISENLYDADFVGDWTVGFDKLVEHVKLYPLEKVEKITGVPQELIKEAARLLATTKPAQINQGASSLDQQAAGFHVGRAICILQTLIGGIDTPGGFISSPAFRANNYRLPELLSEDPLGEDEHPLAYKVHGRPIGEGQGHVLPDVILNEKPYPMKALIIDGTNPLRSWANTGKWREAMGKLDLLVVLSMFPSECTEIADVVLPACSPLEMTEIGAYSLVHQIPYVAPRTKVMQFEEAGSVAVFWLKLAKRMGYDEYFPWEDPVEFINWTLEPAGFTVESLAKEHPNGYFYAPPRYGVYKEKGYFLTPSKKIEIYSEALAKLGYDPLPIHIEPTESPISAPEVAKDYPLILSTGARTMECLQSQMHDLPSLQKLARQHFVAEIHPDTAGKYGIGDGEKITVETKLGSVEINAKLTEDSLPGVVSVPVGYDGCDVNSLISDQPGSHVVGVPEFKALLCKVSRKSS